MEKPHDTGGRPNEEPIDKSEHILADWEKRTHSLVEALRETGVMNTDELRRGIEMIPPGQYEALSYYERWSSSVEAILTEKNVLSTAEIDAKVKDLEESWG